MGHHARPATAGAVGLGAGLLPGLLCVRTAHALRLCSCTPSCPAPRRVAHLCVDGAAAGDDAGEAVGGERDVAQQHAGVDGEVVHPLLRLLQQRLPAASGGHGGPGGASQGPRRAGCRCQHSPGWRAPPQSCCSSEHVWAGLSAAGEGSRREGTAGRNTSRWRRPRARQQKRNMPPADLPPRPTPSPEQLPRDVLHLAPRLLQALVDGHGAHRHRRVAHHPLARLVDVGAGAASGRVGWGGVGGAEGGRRAVSAASL